MDGKDAPYARDGRELTITPTSVLKQDETFEQYILRIAQDIHKQQENDQ